MATARQEIGGIDTMRPTSTDEFFALRSSIQMKQKPGIFLAVACPTPNLDPGAHAAGISEAKGAQPSGCSAAPLRVAPKGA
ncbi:MAG: hypothetical protein ACRDJT_09235 [Actinomycetota bacterium]